MNSLRSTKIGVIITVGAAAVFTFVFCVGDDVDNAVDALNFMFCIGDDVVSAVEALTFVFGVVGDDDIVDILVCRCMCVTRLLSIKTPSPRSP